MYDIKTMIAKEEGKGVEVFLIMDACRSNDLPGGAEGLGFFSSAISEQKVGEVMMLASAAGQESLASKPMMGPAPDLPANRFCQ